MYQARLRPQNKQAKGQGSPRAPGLGTVTSPPREPGIARSQRHGRVWDKTIHGKMYYKSGPFRKVSRNFEKKFKKEKVFIWSKSKRMKKQSAEDRVGTIMISCITTSFSSKYSLSTKSYWEYIKLTLMFLYLWSLRFICIDFVLLVSDFKTP